MSQTLKTNNLISYFKRLIKVALGRARWIKIRQKVPMEFHGNPGYGGWPVLNDSVNSHSIVYSIGVGTDASFDISLMSKHRCKVFACDPTPKSVAWVKDNISDPLFIFNPWALSDYDGTLQLYLPKSHDQVSGSLLPSAPHVSDNYVDAPCFRLSSILKKLGHDKIDVLKMDIEGAEYAVVDDLAKSSNLECIGQVLMEVHEWIPNVKQRFEELVRKLDEAGLVVTWVSGSGREILFARRQQQPK